MIGITKLILLAATSAVSMLLFVIIWNKEAPLWFSILFTIITFIVVSTVLYDIFAKPGGDRKQ